MNLINQHILQHLIHFHDVEDDLFKEIFILIQSEKKEKNLFLLRYIHLLLNEAFSDENNQPQILHLHIEDKLNDDSLLVIAQYILIRFFKENNASSLSSSQNNKKLENLKINLSSKLRRLSICPEGASGKNGGNRIYKNWIKERNDTNALLDFYNKFKNNSHIASKTIFNCQVQLSNLLNDIFFTKPYACKIEDYENYPTFNLLNTKFTVNNIDEINHSIIDNLKTVILFNCERNTKMQYFSLKDLIDYEIDLNKYLILSFGNRNHSVQSLSDKLTLIQNRFRTPSKDSYSILHSEIDFILERNEKKQIPISFIGVETSDFWSTFLLETSIQDLYELRSIKMMNLYSLCLNEDIKQHILNDLFGNNDTSYLISDETKQIILELRDEDVSNLKESLTNVLDLIINSNFKQNLFEKLKNETKFIVDDFVLSNKKLSKLILSSLSLSNENRLISWNDLQSIRNGSVLILSYQDQGKYPYYFYPNIIETTVSKDTIIKAIYHKFLFSLRYQWSKYNAAKERYKLLNHPIRQKYFHWERLKNNIESLKPQRNDDTIWDLEQQYSGNSIRETIKLKLKGERERTYNSSELFIYSTDNKKTFKVDRIDDIIEAVDDADKCFLHHLEEIQENINLYEKMVDTSQQKEELNIIRQRFNIEETETGRLWKILLNQRALITNGKTVYDELKAYLQSKSLKIVSLHHFENNWLNPESDSIAPLSKKVFIELCNFLNLPKEYFILVQRIRNKSKQSNHQSTRRMNRLLQDLFNDGSFDKNIDKENIIKANLDKYKQEHPLDELGIDEKYLGENLITLVDLISTEVTLKELEKFKKVE